MGGQGGDGGDLGRVEVVPEDPLGPSAAGASDDLLVGDDQLEAEVVVGLGQGLLQDLQGVDSGRDHGVGADQAGLDQQGELQVGEAAALAHSGALAVDGDAAADHQVQGSQVSHGDPLPGAGRAVDGGGAAGRDLDPRRVEEDEGPFVGQGGRPCTGACRRPGPAP
jgi:hypothetical protein